MIAKYVSKCFSFQLWVVIYTPILIVININNKLKFKKLKIMRYTQHVKLVIYFVMFYTLSIYNFKSSCYLDIKISLAFYNVTLLHHKSKANIFVELSRNVVKNSTALFLLMVYDKLMKTVVLLMKCAFTLRTVPYVVSLMKQMSINNKAAESSDYVSVWIPI